MVDLLCVLSFWMRDLKIKSRGCIGWVCTNFLQAFPLQIVRPSLCGQFLSGIYVYLVNMLLFLLFDNSQAFLNSFRSFCSLHCLCFAAFKLMMSSVGLLL